MEFSFKLYSALACPRRTATCEYHGETLKSSEISKHSVGSLESRQCKAQDSFRIRAASKASPNTCGCNKCTLPAIISYDAAS